ncbi:MAG: hypothetical protein KJ601_04455 [Nanoarchaeota archaeon]|nr:hypothetical protein [Nanoarchaeota archaeon]MBU1704503.1 hypothetical protein [Nanoarchaeota archaeon]
MILISMGDNNTVAEKIVPVDLYSLMLPRLRQQYRRDGSKYGHVAEAFQEGRAVERLERDPVARDVVRALLRYRRPTVIGGRDYGTGWEYAVIFPGHTNKEIGSVVHGMMNRDGLLDFMFQCHADNHWCFNTEVVTRTTRPGWSEAHFRGNGKLRDGLRELLKPYEGEKPMYEMPQKTSPWIV